MSKAAGSQSDDHVAAGAALADVAAGGSDPAATKKVVFRGRGFLPGDVGKWWFWKRVGVWRYSEDYIEQFQVPKRTCPEGVLK